jgi:hypothetical protein
MAKTLEIPYFECSSIQKGTLDQLFTAAVELIAHK